MNKKLLFSLFIALISVFSKAQNDTIWGKYEYKGAPWVENISKPNIISNGLANRHIAVWASHGRYYDIEKSKWRWQRPILFSTTEDLFTPTIVVPYLLPMLQNAGAVVFTPRERDWQTNEVIVDNDSPNGGYHEINGKKNGKIVLNVASLFMKAIIKMAKILLKLAQPERQKLASAITN